MAVDKSVYQAPLGIDDVIDPVPEDEIEIEVLPDEDEMGEMEQVLPEEPQELEFYRNLAEELDESILEQIGSDCQDMFEDDLASREEWEKTYKDVVS